MKKLTKIDGKFCIVETELVLSSIPSNIGKMENVIENKAHPYPSRETEQLYFRNGRYNPAASNRREVEIKAAIKNKPVYSTPLTTMHRDNNTTIRPNPQMAKAALHTLKFSSILIDKIAKEKHMI